MDPRRLIKVSKYLARHLRHDPGRLGLTLEPGGWVPVEDLLRACAEHHFALSAAELSEVVRRNDKQRFSFSDDGRLIRANQGHTVPVDLQLEPMCPPALLYHGTAVTSVAGILADGLHAGGRHHVHLSLDFETAHLVGSRHGRPLVLVVEAQRMHDDGHVFYCSDNAVWLTDRVPPGYLRRYQA